MSEKDVVIRMIVDTGERCPECRQDHSLVRIEYDLHLEDHESGSGTTYWDSIKKCVMCNYVVK
jgi:hypothetical protein